MEGPAPVPRRASTYARLNTIFNDAVKIIEADFSRPISVEEVARRTVSSPRQLRRAFSLVGGVSYRSVLARVRMRHAADLLASTDVAINEVARRVGYHEPSQFTKAFRRVHGRTPSEFRAMRRSPP